MKVKRLAEAMDYEDVALGNVPRKAFLCGTCSAEMVEVSESAGLCQKCGKRGWNVCYRCPKCGEEVVSWKQDLLSPPYCYSCD